MGTGEIALPSFQMMVARGGLIGLVTQPDRPVGRSSKLRPPRIKEMAQEAGVPVLQPERVKRKSALAEIAALDPELIVVMAYGQILPRSLLEQPRLGCINVHASLLPKHRGASCIQAAIEEGDSESGVTIMYMAEGLDTGDLISAQSIPLSAGETGGCLHDRLAEISPGVLAKALDLISGGDVKRSAQDEEQASYAPKLERGEGEIDWSIPAERLARRIRAYDPWPGSFTTFCDSKGRSKRLKVFPPVEAVDGEGDAGQVLAVDSDAIDVACQVGVLRVREVQAEGARRMPVADFLKGHALSIGDRLLLTGD